MTPHKLSGPTANTSISNDECKHVVVFLHGYGADGNDLIGLSQVFAQALPHSAFYSPDAPEQIEGMNGLFGGRQWFSLGQYDPEMMRRNPETVKETADLLMQGAKTALPVLHRFIDDILARHNKTEKDLILCGFSQGGLMALLAGMSRKVAPKAVIGFSAVPPGQSLIADDMISCKPPVFLAHGEADEIVPFISHSITLDLLKRAGIESQSTTCPGLGHGIDNNGLAAALSFIANL